jgi:hypothetical protein
MMKNVDDFDPASVTHSSRSDSAPKVHSVVCEIQKPSYRTALKEALRGDFESARLALKPEITMTALDEAGQFVFGMSAPGNPKIQLFVK